MRSFNWLRRTRRAFTLVEVVVALAIVLVLAAVALPNVNGYLQKKRVDATADLLTDVVAGVTAFRTDLATYPGRLSELSTVIIAGDTSYNTGTDDSCGGTFSNGERNDWLDDGPYINFLIERTTGLVTPIGVAADSVTRVPNTNTAGRLRINFVNSVAVEDAILLDEIVDAGNGSAADRVTWTAPVNGIVTMYYWLPIDNRC